MIKFLKVFITVLVIIIFMTQCSKNGAPIIEPKFGIYNFSTYTVDSFRFRVILNGEILTDSLRSRVGFFSRAVSFFNTDGRLQIIDAKSNEQLILDTLIQMRTGTSTFSLVQLEQGQKPFIPPPPNEAAPAPGTFKVRFQYTPFVGDGSVSPQPFFYDSVKCFIRKNGINMDTVVLSKYEMTSFYEAPTGGGGLFSVRIVNAINGNQIDASTSPSVGGSYTGFNTVSVSGRAVINDWVLVRIY